MSLKVVEAVVVTDGGGCSCLAHSVRAKQEVIILRRYIKCIGLVT